MEKKKKEKRKERRKGEEEEEEDSIFCLYEKVPELLYLSRLVVSNSPFETSELVIFLHLVRVL